MTKLSVVIPCYNEEENLKRGVLDEIISFLRKKEPDFELIVVDDGSSDNSLAFLQDYLQNHRQARLIKANHLGKAPALNIGIQQAKGEIILLTDMDQSTPIDQWLKLKPYFNQGYQAVIGSRGKGRTNFSFFRQLLSWGFRNIRKSLLLKDIDDTQCGFKAFRSRPLKVIFPYLSVVKEAEIASGWRVSAFDVELLFIMEKLHLPVKEVPVKWEDKDISLGKSRNFLKESIEMFKEILRVKINNWQGRYDGLEKELASKIKDGA